MRAALRRAGKGPKIFLKKFFLLLSCSLGQDESIEPELFGPGQILSEKNVSNAKLLV